MVSWTTSTQHNGATAEVALKKNDFICFPNTLIVNPVSEILQLMEIDPANLTSSIVCFVGDLKKWLL